MTQPVVVPDPWFSPRLTALRDCLCDVLSQEPYTPVCECCIVHSAGLPSMDACDCSCEVGDPPVSGRGTAWVQAGPMFAASSRDSRNCAGLTTVQFRLGIYRCVDVGEVVNGELVPPSCETKMAEALLFLQDAAAMRRVVVCCSAIADDDSVIVGWEPVGPSGGCAGGVTTVNIDLNLLAP